MNRGSETLSKAELLAALPREDRDKFFSMYTPEQFKEIKSQRGEHAFVMDMVDQPITSEEDLREILVF